MATIQITITRTGQTTGTRTLTLADADMDAAVASYQNAANVSINGTATWVQVLNYMFTVLIVNAIQANVQAHSTTPAVVPAPIVIA